MPGIPFAVSAKTSAKRLRGFAAEFEGKMTDRGARFALEHMAPWRDRCWQVEASQAPMPDLLAQVSPLGWEHITLTGEYRWPRSR